MDTSKKADIKIGIGVTTTPNRKNLLEQWLVMFRQHTKMPYHLHVHEDVNYRGVAYSKNENLKALKDCDYIFLFDDDCYPIHDDWVNFFVNSKVKHLLYLTNEIHGSSQFAPNYESNGAFIEVFQNCGGVFMMMTKEVVEKVGAFGLYGQYGFEHAGYSNRIFKAGLIDAPYLNLIYTGKYLKALDYEGTIKSSVSDEVKQKEIEKNRTIFINELNDSNYYCKFTQ